MRNRREVLYKKFNELGFKVGAEIGVRTGENALDMFKCIPGLRLYLIDPWRNIRKHNDRLTYRLAKKTVEPFNAIIIKKKSEMAVLKIPDGSLDFVYIDADHSFDAVLLDIIIWSRKVRTGGIISGHDYRKSKKMGVKPAVDDYVRYHKIDLQLSDGRNWFWET